MDHVAHHLWRICIVQVCKKCCKKKESFQFVWFTYLFNKKNPNLPCETCKFWQGNKNSSKSSSALLNKVEKRRRKIARPINHTVSVWHEPGLVFQIFLAKQWRLKCDLSLDYCNFKGGMSFTVGTQQEMGCVKKPKKPRSDAQMLML